MKSHKNHNLTGETSYENELEIGSENTDVVMTEGIYYSNVSYEI